MPDPGLVVTSPSEAGAGSRRSLWLLGLGALLGLCAAAVGLLRDGGDSSSLPAGAAASVNGALILQDDLTRLLSALAADRRSPLDDDDRRHVLDRLIDEELLVQRGLELGLSSHDRRVRADLTQAVIASVLADVEDEVASRGELEDFYGEEQEYFTRPGRLRVRQVFVRAAREDAEARAQEASARLRQGEPYPEVRKALGDDPVAPLPDAPLPALKLREYLGPTAARTALDLPAGGVSEPVRSGMGVHVLQIVEREPDRVPPFAEIEEEVRAEYRRRRGDRALRSYLEQLRGDADVRVPEAP
ncbi:MAG: peptidylprolyl isomerase [Myxococcota bacterium]